MVRRHREAPSVFDSRIDGDAPRARRLTRRACFIPGLAAALLILPISPRAGRAAVPDVTQTFYVPQVGSVGTPTEGTLATRLFRACPNNDTGSLPNNARIKVVVLDANGNPVPNIPAEDICVLFNGGTSAQGFTGVGADSIISDSRWNYSPLCPTVRCLSADAPTDANGKTYITFAGSTPGSPGVATRNPDRKWGHYDSELPVYVMGYKIAGRLTTAAANGSYVLRIKNFDVVGGMDPNPNRGERVTFADLNALANGLGGGCGGAYWVDFNGDNLVTVFDLNLLMAHYSHDCRHPNDP